MPIRVGFIGTGGIATVHLRCLSQIADAEIAALYDVDPARSESAAAAYGGKPYGEVVQMLDAEKLDAVYVCVPPHAHGAHELELAARGIPFLVEKPLANNLETARSIAEAVDRANIITSVGYHWRYMSFTRLARERLEGQTVGMVLGYWMGGMPGADWWRRMDQSGGQMVEQTTHIVDLARFFCGEVQEVFSTTGTRALGEVENFSVSDVGTMALRFANGAVGNIANTCLLKGIGYTVGLHLISPELIVEVDSDRLRLLQAGREEIVRSNNNAYLEEDQIFIRALQSGDDTAILSPYQDAIRSLEVTLAANESARTGQPVTLRDT